MMVSSGAVLCLHGLAGTYLSMHARIPATQLLMRSLADSRTHSTHSPTEPPTHLFVNRLIHSFAHSLTHTFA